MTPREIILSRDGKEEGTIYPVFEEHMILCTMEGCNGSENKVVWEDGSVTYVCGKSITWDKDHKKWRLL